VGGGAGGGGVVPDGGTCTPSPYDGGTTLPPLLSATGLYTNIATQTVAPGARAYTPQFPLWSDGATKRRWIELPPCTQIDISDMDHWVMPVGTRLWKEFAVNGQVVETRMILKASATQFVFGAYQWNLAGTDATLLNNGVQNANGTTHDIPSRKQCEDCHLELRERVLGFGAIQLSHSGSGLTMSSLSAAGLLTVPAPAGFTVPGGATAQQALGYLHANCGGCHNPDGLISQFSRDPMHLRLSVTETTVDATGTWRTAVNVLVTKTGAPSTVTHRIKSGAPSASAVSWRMSVRGTGQMPPLGTETVDTAGLAAVNAWISSLPP